MNDLLEALKIFAKNWAFIGATNTTAGHSLTLAKTMTQTKPYDRTIWPSTGMLVETCIDVAKSDRESTWEQIAARMDRMFSKMFNNERNKHEPESCPQHRSCH